MLLLSFFLSFESMILKNPAALSLKLVCDNNSKIVVRRVAQRQTKDTFSILLCSTLHSHCPTKAFFVLGTPVQIYTRRSFEQRKIQQQVLPVITVLCPVCHSYFAFLTKKHLPQIEAKTQKHSKTKSQVSFWFHVRWSIL
jgi:hypothetical protein